MNRIIFFTFSSFFFSCAAISGTSLNERWSTIETPLRTAPEVVGSYTAGCVAGAKSLAPDGPGYQVVRQVRRRFFGHPNLTDLLRRVGRNVQKGGIEQGFLIADLSQPRGGPMSSGHQSHQVGLDADIWFWNPTDSGQKFRSLDLDERQNISVPSMLNPSRDDLEPSYWSLKKIYLLKMFAQEKEVQRVFVHPVIKRELCRKVPKESWIQKVRPWWGHHEHFHVRLECPLDSKDCVAQMPTPPGNGCDETLDWWFTDEAKEVTPLVEFDRFAVTLPDRCEKILLEPEQYLHPDGEITPVLQ